MMERESARHGSEVGRRWRLQADVEDFVCSCFDVMDFLCSSFNCGFNDM